MRNHHRACDEATTTTNELRHNSCWASVSLLQKHSSQPMSQVCLQFSLIELKKSKLKKQTNISDSTTVPDVAVQCNQSGDRANCVGSRLSSSRRIVRSGRRSCFCSTRRKTRNRSIIDCCCNLEQKSRLKCRTSCTRCIRRCSTLRRCSGLCSASLSRRLCLVDCVVTFLFVDGEKK